MSLACFNAFESTMTWMGIGNVGGLLVRADGTREVLLLRSGVIGGALPALQASVLPVLRGDTLILATDGVGDGFYDETNISDPPPQLADRILKTHSKGTDDAMVLVAHFLAETS